MKIKLTSLLAALLLATGAAAQPVISAGEQWVNGFFRKISGENFTYHSSIPLARESLLIRATDGNSAMEWETAAVPEKIKGKYVTFVWLAGLGSSPGRARFDLSAAGSPLFSFWVDGTDQWQLETENGATLGFRKEMTDQHGDRFGFMFLKMPAALLTPAKPLRLKMQGSNAGLTSWYMTFRFPLENGLTFKAFPALFAENGAEKQLAVAGILYFGKPVTATIFIDGKPLKKASLQFGYNYLKVGLPLVSAPVEKNWRLVAGNFTQEGKILLTPEKKWRVNFVQHTHTDIGYTRSQTEILGEHLRYIDYALDYCDLTDTYPAASRFRWTCEASWAVGEYLKCRPAAQIERLKKRVQEGRIELTGMYFNFDEMPDEQILAASLEPLKLFRQHNLPVKTAMQNDVNGIGWCLNDFYADLGIRYLNMGTHGHRALICFDKPTLFWWESPSGKRMLAYRGEHYMTGNTVFKIHAEDFNAFEDQLLTYLTDLEAKKYPFDLISIQHSGFLTDNSPPSTLACDMIRQWNEKYRWPQLKTATATEFFEEMETRHGAEFEVIRGAWPDWWTDGFGAAAREVAATRQAAAELLATNGGLTMAALQGSPLPNGISQRIALANNALLFYTEHTMGYSESVREPFHQTTMEQRAIKESYAWEAFRRIKMAGEETMGLLQSHLEREKEPSLVVYNTLSWPRSGLVPVYIDHELIPRYANFRITDPQGKTIPVQAISHRSDGTYWGIWVDDIPAFGFRKYLISTEKEKPVMPAATRKEPVTMLENHWYKVTIDTVAGAVSALFDKELNRELVDPAANWKLGQFIYETLGNREQLESFRLTNFRREPLAGVRFERLETGDVWNAIILKGNSPAALGAGGITVEIRLYNTTKRIDLIYSVLKKSVTDPEAVYIAFPFTLPGGALSFDVQGGVVRAGIDQIPGSANDWNTVQNFARLSCENAQIVVGTLEAPLMQFGNINTGRYQAGALPESTHFYGWPMNNYWTTNFNAEQRGGHTFCYPLTSSGKTSPGWATRFGWGIRVPLLARVLPGGGQGGSPGEKSLLEGWPENILLVNIAPLENQPAAILQVRETEGVPTDFRITRFNRTPPEIRQVDALGDEISGGNTRLEPFASKFFKISWP